MAICYPVQGPIATSKGRYPALGLENMGEPLTSGEK